MLYFQYFYKKEKFLYSNVSMNLESRKTKQGQMNLDRLYS